MQRRFLTGIQAIPLLSLIASLLAGCGGDEAKPGSSGGPPPEVLPPLPEIEGPKPLEDINPDPRIVEVNLVARENTAQLVEGDPTKLFNYNDEFPGPLLHARVGDRVIVHFTNEMPEETVIHWHGLRISDLMDGSPVLQSPVQPGTSFTYDFVVPDAGTFWYHTHLKQTKQLEYGLYGAIVVHEKDFPTFSAERIFMGDDIRLNSLNQISPFQTSGPDVGAGRVGNTLLINGNVVDGKGKALELKIPRGAIERWRFVLATNALSYGLRMQGADARVISTDGGLLPEAFPLDRVEIAPGQRYDFEVRPKPDATEVVLQAMVLVVNENNEVVEAPFDLVHATIEGETATPEPIYTLPVLPALDVATAEKLTWKLAGGVVDNEVQFTINGIPGYVGDDHEHLLLHTFQPNVPVQITVSSSVSPKHPFHIHGQFFQVIARGFKPVFEPGLRDTVEVRGTESATIISYFENPGRWMIHCHISEHSERGMMADIQVGEPSMDHTH